MKIIYEYDFIRDMRTMNKAILDEISLRTLLKMAINNCELLTRDQVSYIYGEDEDPNDYCYEVVQSDGENAKTFWFSIDDFWNNWHDFLIENEVI